MIVCAECRSPQWQTPSGLTCANGHGGADSIELTDLSVDANQVKAHLARLQQLVESGIVIDRANLLWLIELAQGGMWGRFAARAVADMRTHREALRALVYALVTGASWHWTAREWAPYVALLAPRPTDQLPPLPDLRRLDIGFRLEESGEKRTE